MKNNSIAKQNFKLIELELSNYYNSKKELQDISESILFDSGNQQEVRGTNISKPTERKGIQLVSNAYLKQLTERVNAIEYMVQVVKDSGDKKKLEFIELKYFKRKYTDYGLTIKLDISHSKVYRWRKEVVALIANRLGWKV